jgi:hypothetical protein
LSGVERASKKVEKTMRGRKKYFKKIFNENERERCRGRMWENLMTNTSE